ncbi:hypothetical protein [Streptosporangium sp. 'caverna']|uniref:hypothetical protein n=1 Tax=Streptosporangium sp. 'caverna' TaxID=2202249 RepID=UPI000D7E0015|nr:hypothetical protein [Streptosporangium sp. 'caverna']AWS45460.1 hypothetical protein DKM19_33175 [Streptosporangium sp. 'caverna']
MTRLRNTLKDLAEEAPLVNLADAAIAIHRRRRRTMLAVSTVATVAALVATTAGAVVVWPRGDHMATPQRVDTVPDLPDGRVGAINHAYQTNCTVNEATRDVDCSAVEWRVATRSGRTYRVPQALVSSRKALRTPVAISRDGRMLAYYSHDAQAHVVRDLVSGVKVTSPVTVKEDRIGPGSMLAVSEDGRYVAFDPREGSKDPGLLIDMRTGKTVSIPGKYEVTSIKNGAAELIRYRKTDLWLMPVTGGGKPVRFDGVFIMFSELSPDGRTVVAVDFPEVRKRVLTLLDAKTGRTLRKVPIRGLPKDGSVDGTATWLSRSEVTIVVSGKGLRSSYVVDVNTGRARRWADYSVAQFGQSLTLPGVGYSW